MEKTRRPGQRAGLTRADILAAARELLAHGGIDALTMRAMALRLGVAPNALYSHVESKTRLLDDLLDDVLARVEIPEGIDDPIEGLTTLMTSTFDVLTAHPDLVPIYLTRQGARGRNAARLGEIMHTLLARAGVIGVATAEARRVLIIHTIGFAAFTTSAPDTERSIPLEESRENFGHSLRWLLVGITNTAAVSRPAPRHIEGVDYPREESPGGSSI